MLLVGSSCNNSKTNNNTNASNNEIEDEAIQLSIDKKTIEQGKSVILKIDDAQIFNWFKTKSGLCSNSNNDNDARNLFCTNSATFFNKTNFINIYPTKNKKYIAFEISSEEMSPDAVVCLYDIESNKINWLTNYYLGNKFLSYSPDESKFIYQNSCWEGMCGLTIKSTSNTYTLKEINNPDSADTRDSKTVFNEWIDNNTISYTLKNHLGNKDYTESF